MRATLLVLVTVATWACSRDGLVAGQPVQPTGARCTFGHTARIGFVGGGEVRSLDIDTQASCPWQLNTSDAWIAIGPRGALAFSGSGPASVPVGVVPNATGRQRTGSVFFQHFTPGLAPGLIEIVQSTGTQRPSI